VAPGEVWGRPGKRGRALRTQGGSDRALKLQCGGAGLNARFICINMTLGERMDATEPAGRGCMVVFGHVVWGIGEGGVVRGVVVRGGGGTSRGVPSDHARRCRRIGADVA
jgi:hypothetical protein